MRRFLRKHLGDIAASHTILASVALIALVATVLTVSRTDLIALIANATSSLTGSPATLYFMPYGDSNDLYVGETSSIDINLNANVPINAIGTTIGFPTDSLEVIGISKKKSVLDLWTEETAINEDSGEVHFSGGSVRPGGLVGTGTALTLTVRAKKAGDATLAFKEAQVFPDDGKGKPLSSELRSFTYHIVQKSSPAPASTPQEIAPPINTEEVQMPRSADLDGNGSVNLIDVSILAIHLFGSYDARYDLNLNGAVDLPDLSILFSKMRGE